MRAEDVVDQRGPDVDSHRLLRSRVDVGPVPVHLSARDLGDQGRGAPGARERELGR